MQPFWICILHLLDSIFRDVSFLTKHIENFIPFVSFISFFFFFFHYQGMILSAYWYKSLAYLWCFRHFLFCFTQNNWNNFHLQSLHVMLNKLDSPSNDTKLAQDMQNLIYYWYEACTICFCHVLVYFSKTLPFSR